MVRETSVTALKALYQMETFRTSRMTAPGAAAGCLSWVRAARSGSLVWPGMSRSSCSTTYPAPPRRGTFRFSREHLVNRQLPLVAQLSPHGLRSYDLIHVGLNIIIEYVFDTYRHAGIL